MNVDLIISAASTGLLSRFVGRRGFYWMGSAFSAAGLFQIFSKATHVGRVLR
jgi:hypothetical protein